MDPIPSGSRGPVLLSLQGSHTLDDASAVLVASQQWSFQAQYSARPSRFSLSQLKSEAGISTSVRLTPNTTIPSIEQLSLFPGKGPEVGSSVDADIISAQRFLHQCHPEIDIPDHLLSQVIYDNAQALEDTAHELDGSHGLADAQAIAVLGPVESQQRRIYGVVCVGGQNRDCLLLHQLEVVSRTDDASRETDADQPASDHAKGKAKAAETGKLRFLPAHHVERQYKTPLLQIVSSPNKTHIAVRTHSGTSFLALKHKGGQDGPLRLYLETVHQTKYGIDGSCQHQDICFSTISPTVAVSVDRLGNIDLYNLQTEESTSQPTDSASDSPASDDAVEQPQSASEHPATPSTSQTPPTHPLVTRRAPAQLLRQALDDDDAEDVEDATRAATDPVGQPSSTPAFAKQAPFHICFGYDEKNLFFLTRHALLHIKLDNTHDASEAGTAPQISILLKSTFCLTSFRRARFFSMATADTKAGHSLLALCSSDAIYWFDLRCPSKPLFATAHHRGDDPTLFLARLPSMRQEPEALRWALSSRRNDMLSCYTVRPQLQEGPGADLLLSNDDTSSSSRSRYVLDQAPVLIPNASSEHELRRPAAPPFFLDVDELLLNDQGPHLLVKFDVTNRGALLAHLIEVDFEDAPAQNLTSSNRVLEMEILPPSTDSLLYTDASSASVSVQDHTGCFSDVKTRVLNYQELHRTLFSRGLDATLEVSQENSSNPIRRSSALLQNLPSDPTKGNAAVHAATFSLGQLIRDSTRNMSSRNQGEGAPDRGMERAWSTALGLNEDGRSFSSTAGDILDLRSDIRHTLSSLGGASSQKLWSKAASEASSSLAAGMMAGRGRSSNLPLLGNDIVENALSRSDKQVDVTPYLPTNAAVKGWTQKERQITQRSLREASRRMLLDMALETEIFVRPKARILDEGAPTQRPQRRQGTNWTAFEHRDIYSFVEEQGDIIPPPHIGSVGLSFFAPLRGGDIEAAAGTNTDGSKPGLNEAELESLLPSTSSTARLLLAEWQLGEDPADYTYLDPFEGLHRLPRASRMQGPTARARSRSFSRASSASTEDRSRSRSRSRSRKQSAAPSFSQSGAFASQANSQGPMSSYPPSSVGYSQAGGPSSGAPPTLISRRKRQQNDIVSRSQPIRAPIQSLDQTSRNGTPLIMRTSAAAQSQPAAPRFGFGGSFGDLTPTVSPASSQVGTPTQSRFGASTQIEAGRFGARPAKPDKPPKKKKRASGF